MSHSKIEFTPQQLKNMATEYVTGSSLKKLSEIYNMSISAIRRKLIAQDVQLRPKGRPVGSTHVIKLTLQDRLDIVEKYKGGTTSITLGAEYEVTKERICQICRAAGIIRTRQSKPNSGNQ